MVISITCKVTK